MENSTNTHAGLDESIRNKKALKLLSILEKYVDLKACDLLDIGTGSGHIAHFLSKKCRSVTSVNLADERVVKEDYHFVKTEDEHLPFPDEKFDVVVSNHVVEHVNDQTLHIKEIHRVLKKGGHTYLATPNKYALIEPHFHLPFLSWLPRDSAGRYLKLMKGKVWDVFPLSLGDLKVLTYEAFDLEDLSAEILKNPKEYNLDMFTWFQPFLRLMPITFLNSLKPFLPSFIVILRKK